MNDIRGQNDRSHCQLVKYTMHETYRNIDFTTPIIYTIVMVNSILVSVVTLQVVYLPHSEYQEESY